MVDLNEISRVTWTTFDFRMCEKGATEQGKKGG